MLALEKTMFNSRNPFIFYSRLHLIELTGIKASTLQELLEDLRKVSGSCIYHHTHHFIQRHQYLSPEPPNDFAYWVSEILGDKQLGEELASIDAMAHPTIRSIREALISVIEKALKSRARLKNLNAPESEEFTFLKSVSFIFPTQYMAYNLKEFANCLSQVSMSSIYFHMFEARLRLERPTNDFSNWLLTSLNEKQCALKIAQLDPYTQTVESLRTTMLKILEKRL